MRSVVVDANVLVSFFVDRNPKQRDAADELLQLADAAYVLQASTASPAKPRLRDP